MTLHTNRLHLVKSKNQVPGQLSNGFLRNELLLSLQTAFNYSVVLFRSPAGFGKTTTVLQWAAQQQQIAWFSIEEADNDELHFAAYFVQAINQVIPCPDTFATVKSGNFESFNILLSMLFDEIGPLENQLFLVLDDIHLINNHKIIQGLKFFIKHSPASITLILLSRTKLTFGLASLRVSNKLLELTERDLAYSNIEAAEFFKQRLDFSVEQQKVDEFVTLTEGWPTAFQLMCLLAKDAESFNRLCKDFRGDSSFVMDYLAEEVLMDTSEATQNFLIFSSILPRFDAQLCQDVLGEQNAQEILENIEQEGLFLTPLDQDRHWYRYHALFSDFLRHQLQLNHANQIAGLHKKASVAWLAKGYINQSIEHAVLSKDKSLIIERLTTSGWGLLRQGKIEPLIECFEQLTEQDISQNPTLTLLRVWLAQMQFRYDEVEPLLQIAHKALDQSKELSEEFQEELLAIRAQILINSGDFQKALELAQTAIKQSHYRNQRVLVACMSVEAEANYCQGHIKTALELMQNVEKQARSLGMNLSVFWSLCLQGEMQMQLGKLTAAYDQINVATQYAQDHYLLQMPLVEFAYRIKAQILLEWHQIDEAEQAASQGSEILRRHAKHWQLQCNSLNIKIALLRGDFKTANKWVDINRILLKEHQLHRDWQANAWSAALNLWEQTQDVERAGQWLESNPQLCSGQNHFEQCFNRNVCRAYLIVDEPEKALPIITEQINAAKSFWLPTSENRDLILLARVYWQLSLNNEASRKVITEFQNLAIETMWQALKKSVQTGFLSSFLRAFNQVEPILLRLQKQKELEPLISQKIKRLLDLGRNGQQKQRLNPADFDEQLIARLLEQPKIPDVVSPLTKREWQVLGLIYSGLSNDQIASRMNVAPTTIKSHIRNLYQKLDVKNRKQAIELAGSIIANY